MSLGLARAGGLSSVDSFAAIDNLPEGAAGTRETLKIMRDEVIKDLWRIDLRDRIQRLVYDIPPKDYVLEIATVFNFVRSRVRYALDVWSIETIQAPHVTLQNGYGDCDDHCVLLACALMLIGHQCAFCALGFEEPGSYSHVIVLCRPAGDGRAIALDATEPYPMGWFPPGVTCKMIAPIEVA